MMTAVQPLEFSVAADAARGHLRPQLVRGSWSSLDGEWEFAYDDEHVGLAEHWSDPQACFDRRIIVPFPPESAASGIGDKGYHPVCWYRRTLTRSDLDRAGHVAGNRVLIHFGAVDYGARVWLGGVALGGHEGGQTPLAVEITDVVSSGGDSWMLVVRAEDDPLDASQPRGKQDWQLEPHGIWYDRTSGIWQPVWLESVPPSYIAALAWRPDVPRGQVVLDLQLDRRPTTAVQVDVTLSYQQTEVGRASFAQREPESRTVISIPQQANGQAYHTLLWSPEYPRWWTRRSRPPSPTGLSTRSRAISDCAASASPPDTSC